MARIHINTGIASTGLLLIFAIIKGPAAISDNYGAKAYQEKINPTPDDKIQHVLDQTRDIEYLLRGYEFFDKKQYQKAVDEFNQAIQLNLDNAFNCSSQLAEAYLKLNQSDKAIETYATAIRMQPTFLHAYEERAKIYQTLGQYENAIADYDKIIAIHPTDSIGDLAYSGRAYAYSKIGQYESAITDENKLISHNPQLQPAYVLRADAYEKLGQYGKALTDYSKAIALDPADISAYVGRADTYNVWLKQYDKAIADYSKAITLRVHNADDYWQRGYAYESLGRYQEAIGDYSECLRLKPNDASTYGARGNTYLELGSKLIDQEKLAEAENMLNQSQADFEKAYGKTDMRLAICFALIGDVQELQGKEVQSRDSYAQELYIRAKHPDDTQVFIYHEKSPNCEHFYKNGVAYTKMKGNDLMIEIACMALSNNRVRVDMQMVNNSAKAVDVIPENIELNTSGSSSQKLQQVSLGLSKQIELVSNTVAPGSDIAGTVCFQLPTLQTQNSGELKIVVDKTTFVFNLLIHGQNVVTF